MASAGNDARLDSTKTKARTEKIDQPSQLGNIHPQPLQPQPSSDEQKRPPKRCDLLASSSIGSAPGYQHAALPSLELLFYVGVIAFLFFYIPYQIHQVSEENAANLRSYLGPAWSLFGRRLKDESNYQWRFFFNVMTAPPVVISIAVYVLLGQVVIAVAPRFKKHFMLFYSVMWIYAGLGGSILLVLLLHSVLLYLACQLRRQIFVWIVVLMAIASINVNFFMKVQRKYLGYNANASVCIASSTLRLLCFGLESCRSSAKTNKAPTGYNLLDLLLYNFYLPVFSYGPIIRYDMFLIQINRQVKLFSWSELKHILKELILCIAWGIIAEILIRYLYFDAITHHEPTWLTLDPVVLGCVVLYHLCFFQLTVFILFSYARALALFDRIEAPQPPICIFSMHFFRDMWKYFDRGLNAVVTRYIYIPLGGSRHGLLRQSVAALSCFVFISWWHGGEVTLFTWAILNWLGVQIEVAVLAFSDGFGPLRELQHKMSAPMLRRFYGLCAVPNYIFLALSNLVYVIGPSKTWFAVQTIVSHDWPWYMLKMTGVWYCCMQVVNELEKRVGKKALLDKRHH